MSQQYKDEEEVDEALVEGEVIFDPSDTTAAAPFPKKFVMVLPTGCTSQSGGLTLMVLRHPRHGESQVVAVGADGTVCEVQEHQRKRFGEGGADAWFIGGSTVEPSSSLYIATPIDPTFLALFVLLKSEVTDTMDGSRFEDAYTLLGRDDGVALLPPVAQARIEEAFLTVCDVEMISEKERFFRLSRVKCVNWLRRKHARLSDSSLLGELAGAKRDRDGPGPAAFKAAALLSEYLDARLGGLLVEASGCNPSAPVQAPTVATTNTIRDDIEMRRLEVEEAAAKKKRTEASKSSSVKKLEKAGRPAGTPSLFSMFAKK